MGVGLSLSSLGGVLNMTAGWDALGGRHLEVKSSSAQWERFLIYQENDNQG